MQLHRLADCPEDPIRGWTVGILGYGNQGRGQALNLRDSGYEVVVVADSERPSARLARADGFSLVTLAEAPRTVDLLAVLAPDEVHAKLVQQLVARIDASSGRTQPKGNRLQALVFAHGFSLVFDDPPFDPSWDVFVIAPAGPGVQLRDLYVAGKGMPALAAVLHDASGQAAVRARAYGAAIGSARAGLLWTTVREEAEVDLFGEQVVLCGGMNALTQSAFETLVEAGYPEEMAYLECVQQLRLTAELVERFGVAGMRQRISRTAHFGDVTRGPRVIGDSSRHAMREILAEIRAGKFAEEWLEERSGGRQADGQAAAGDRTADGLERAERDERLERAGRFIRGLFGGEAAP